MSNPKRVLLIAMTCHVANMALQKALGEEALDWNHVTDDVRNSAVAGVEYHLSNPDITPEQSHESWMNWRLEQGWVFGEVKDLANKVHPNLVPYEQLSQMQKAKDYLFRDMVHALKDLPLEGLEKVSATVDSVPSGTGPAPATIVLAADGFTPIEYIGPRETYREGAYGSGLVFHKGSTLPVPNALAAKLLRHADVYRVGKLSEAAAANAQPPDTKGTQTEEDKEEADLQDTRDSITRMTSKKSVAEFVKTNFNQDLDQRASLADLKASAIQLVDRFGVAKA